MEGVAHGVSVLVLVMSGMETLPVEEEPAGAVVVAPEASVVEATGITVVADAALGVAWDMNELNMPGRPPAGAEVDADGVSTATVLAVLAVPDWTPAVDEPCVEAP